MYYAEQYALTFFDSQDKIDKVLKDICNILESREKRKKDVITSESEMINEVRSIIGVEFDQFLDSLKTEEVLLLLQYRNIKDKICRRLRNGGHKHEWCPVSRYIIFKMWGLSVNDIKTYISLTSEVYFSVNGRISKHGEGCSSDAHNEIFDLIELSKNFNDYKQRLNKWADEHLTNKYGEKTSRKFLPLGLQV